MTFVFRFAPSPNGALHLGHVRSAVLNAEMAKACGGRFLLRIEDIDAARCRPAYETAIYDDLSWLGLRWEEPVRRQSDHMDDYATALGKLFAMGVVYRSFDSRAENARSVSARESSGEWPRDPDGAPLYAGAPPSAADETRWLAQERPFAWRLAMEKAVALTGPMTWEEHGHADKVAAKPSRWGDVVVARKDVPTSYHLSVVVDDALQGVTDVVRGLDLYEATSIHRLLQTLLGLPAPRYHHHALLRDDNGRKLSKSDKATGLRVLRDAGATPTDVRRLALVGIA